MNLDLHPEEAIDRQFWYIEKSFSVSFGAAGCVGVITLK